MLQQSARRVLPALSHRAVAARTYVTHTDNPVPANDPNPKERNSPVSSTNALPTVAPGRDKALVEDPFAGEQKRVMQAPNRADVWSRSQQPRSKAMVGPRFEQTIIEDQVRFSPRLSIPQKMREHVHSIQRDQWLICSLFSSPAPTPLSNLSTSNLYDGPTSAKYLATAVAGHWDTRGYSSTWINRRSAGARIVECHM